MQYGDIGTQSQTIQVVFEGLLAVLKEKPKRRFRRHRFGTRIGDYEPNFLIDVLTEQIWNTEGPAVEVVTFLGEKFAGEVESFLDELGFPCQGVYFTHPNVLAQSHAYRQDVVGVYDPEPTRWLRYGRLGKLTYPKQLLMIGS
ncbi:hypothetical protein [Streptomyces sp. H27-C3]|uniref:hypothetical protein n=1 Tax=Streptomyces sp. H27-C3 TaxID=3046305 RepID=UPI0024B99B84|nr:hypothetical protein [Streptomyces sp. H27-C3]MDJ0463154.1 hypothetical protein [Streptomyces sp. H27-C3]